jgi:hypothetical protein
MDVHLEDIRVIYPNCVKPGSTHFFSPADYDPMIMSIGRVLVQWDEDDYQGDTVALIERDGQYGILIFGWGSCSGCDALQACDSYQEIDDLRRELFDATRWGTADEIIAWVHDHDWNGSFLYSRFPTERFIAAVDRALSGDPLTAEPCIVTSDPEPQSLPPSYLYGSSSPSEWGTTRRIEITDVKSAGAAMTSADLTADAGEEADGVEHAG